LAVAGLAAPLAAQPPEGGPPPGGPDGPRGPGGFRGGGMRMLPATRAEAEQAVRERFQQRDTNHDGFLTADELGERGAMMIERQDADHDGKISLAEAVAGSLALFDRADANHDGRIDDAERTAAMAMGGWRGGGEGRRGGNLNMLPATRAEMQQMTQAIFARQDANHDGFLDAGELGERAQAALARLDADHDGKLSAAENSSGLLTLFDR